MSDAENHKQKCDSLHVLIAMDSECFSFDAPIITVIGIILHTVIAPFGSSLFYSTFEYWLMKTPHSNNLN